MSLERRDLQSVYNQHIGLHKAILWEEAKGKLRALAAAEGQTHSGVLKRRDDWEAPSKAIEKFIKEFKDEGLHE